MTSQKDQQLLIQAQMYQQQLQATAVQKDTINLQNMEIKKALEALEKDNTQAAETVLIREDPSRSSDLYFSIDETIRQLHNIPLAEIKELEAGDETKQGKILELNKALKEVAAIAKLSLGD